MIRQRVVECCSTAHTDPPHSTTHHRFRPLHPCSQAPLDLHGVFNAYCSFGGHSSGGSGLDSKGLVKLCKVVLLKFVDIASA